MRQGTARLGLGLGLGPQTTGRLLAVLAWVTGPGVVVATPLVMVVLQGVVLMVLMALVMALEVRLVVRGLRARKGPPREAPRLGPAPPLPQPQPLWRPWLP